ncbi:MAG TPA: carbon starvation CstA family protein [Nitrospira sp.]|nr:carbon starvation CstA family protein [Nitrospira sp.]
MNKARLRIRKFLQRLPRPVRYGGWIALVLLVAYALAVVAGLVRPEEKVNALWLVVAASCVHVLAFRFYGRFLARKVLELNDDRSTPAHTMTDGVNFVPTSRWVLLGHHFAAIAGAGPLLGPVLAAQYGFFPGFLWLLVGAVIAGAGQDFVILGVSMRRKGCSLVELAYASSGPVSGMAAMLAVLFVVTIAMAGLGLAVVNALDHNPWGTFTLAMTIPIALLMGGLGRISPAATVPITVMGVVLLMFAIVGGRIVANSSWATWFEFGHASLVWMLAGYGFVAAVLPIWLLLIPRDYLSSTMKVAVIALLAVGVVVIHPSMEMPRFTPFIAGGGPIIKGRLFPFLFITIACGAISGFHSLVASGTTSKLIDRESHATLGYVAMLMESFVGVIALIAASILHPGDYFGINTLLSRLELEQLGFPVVHLDELCRLVEQDCTNRVGGGVSLAIGMASIFAGLPGFKEIPGLMAYWYQFALLFEALFILTTIDAGTRVARYLVQELGGRVYRPFGDFGSLPAAVIASLLVVGAWSILLYTGSVSNLWPMFGVANQLLGTVALCVGTSVLIRIGRARYLWVTVVPMVTVAIVTLSACVELISQFLGEGRRVNAVLVLSIGLLAVVVLLDAGIKWVRWSSGNGPLEAPPAAGGQGGASLPGRCC